MLELRAINTFRGPAHVLRSLSLRVGDGEAVCLVGRNGAGKTTTLESAINLLPIRSGTVLFKDRDITRLPAHARARLGIGYSPRGAGLFPAPPGGENRQLGRGPRGGAADRCCRADGGPPPTPPGPDPRRPRARRPRTIVSISSHTAP